MKSATVLFVLTIVFSCLSTHPVCAQNNLIVYNEPNESQGGIVDASEAKVIFLSPNKNLLISHTMGFEKGVLAGQEKNGEYRFELTHAFSEDELEDGFCKTSVTVSTPDASKSFLLTLKPGKCYMGRFEIPFKFSFLNESNDRAVYAQENKAKVTFMSELDDLNIRYNGKVVVQNGKAASSVNYIRVEKGRDEQGLTLYDLIFSTDVPEAQTEAFKRPVFTLKSSFPEELRIELNEGSLLRVKTMYNYRILLQLVQTVIKEVEVHTSAYMQLLGNAKQALASRKFTSAQGFYKMAQDTLAKDKSKNTEEERLTLQRNIDHMEACAEWDKKAAMYMEYILELKKSGGSDMMSNVEEAFREALVCYTNLDRLHPDPVYKKLIELTEKKLDEFNFIVIEGSVRDKRDNTKRVSGVDIYGVHSPTFEDNMQDEKPKSHELLGAVDKDGTFRVQVDKNTYLGLLFVPAKENKAYKRNGFVSLQEQKHLKTAVYIY